MNTEWSKPTKYVAAIGLMLLGIYVLYLSRPVIPLLIGAALIAVIVRPVILWLHIRLHLPLGLAVAVVYLAVAFLVPLALLLAVPVIVDAVRYVASLDYPAIIRSTLEWLRLELAAIQEAQLPLPTLDVYVDETIASILNTLENTEPTAASEPPSVDSILQSLGTALTTTFGAATNLVGAVVSQIALLLFMILASIYINLSASTYRGALLRMAPPPYRPEIAMLMDRIERIWNRFFRGELSLMLVIGGITWLGLTVLGMPGAFSLAIIAGLLELIPNLGPIIATIPAVVVALLQGSNNFAVSNLAFAGIIILFYILVQQLENNIIVPRVLGDAVDLPPLIVMSGVLVGVSVGGILGALLATPIVASGREIVRYIYQKIQGKEPFPPEEAPPEPAAPLLTGLRQRLQQWISRLTPSDPSASRSRVSDITPSPNIDPQAENYSRNQQEISRDDD